MARLEKNNYKSIQKNELNDPVVFVVDMIKGFVNIGPLHDEVIGNVEKNIENLLTSLDCNNVFVCDSHPPKTREFNSFPTHCVIGSEEAEVVDSLKPFVKHVIKKNSTNTFMAPEFEEFLNSDLKYYRDIIVTGCCTDLCVLHFVLSLNTWLNEHNMNEYRIVVVENCTETYHIPEIHEATFWNDVAFRMMEMNDCCFMCIHNLLWKEETSCNILTYLSCHIIPLYTIDRWVLVRILLDNFLVITL